MLSAPALPLDTAVRSVTVIAAIAAAGPSAVGSSTIGVATVGAVPVLDDETPVLGLMDLELLESQFAELSRAFLSTAVGHTVLHAVACKAVPLRSVLKLYAELGAGCEVASAGELELAIAAGFAPEKIVFDSPAKTISQLRRGLELGVGMNVDNFAELERLDALFAEAGTDGTRDASVSAGIGLRINPQTGAGTIGALSTATKSSKFGIGLADPGARETIFSAYLERPWLTQIHVHSGSQGVTLARAAEGIGAAVELAEEINRVAAEAGRAKQVTRIDIGGGLPVNFAGEEITPSFADYRAVLDEFVPNLFDFDIVTEFGRALAAKAGTVLTRVEYAKPMGPRRIAITQAGVQLATRTAYAPEDWPLRILPYDAAGRPKSAETLLPHDVAGPACFAGDLLARDRMLPELQAGDLIAVPETGAYYFSNPFSYNLLPRVPVIGYRNGDGNTVEEGSSNTGAALEFLLIHRGQTVQEIVADAGPPEAVPLGDRGEIPGSDPSTAPAQPSHGEEAETW